MGWITDFEGIAGSGNNGSVTTATTAIDTLARQTKENLEIGLTPHTEVTEIKYLWSSSELLAPQVGAIEIWLLETGKYEQLQAAMIRMAESLGIEKPLMIVDLIFKSEKLSQLGSSGQPYPIRQDEWERFVADIPEYCGDKVPKVYMVDWQRFTAPI